MSRLITCQWKIDEVFSKLRHAIIGNVTRRVTSGWQYSTQYLYVHQRAAAMLRHAGKRAETLAVDKTQIVYPEKFPTLVQGYGVRIERRIKGTALKTRPPDPKRRKLDDYGAATGCEGDWRTSQDLNIENSKTRCEDVAPHPTCIPPNRSQ